MPSWLAASFGFYFGGDANENYTSQKSRPALEGLDKSTAKMRLPVGGDFV
jgi:hypothetical protein